MGQKDARVDAYIAKSAQFAKPILNHLRQLVHSACPEANETLKWGMPSFTYKGILCGMGAFKAHCTFGFWRQRLMTGLRKYDAGGEAMGQFGRITALSDLPADKIIRGFLLEAKRLNDAGIKSPAKPKRKKARPLKAPADLMKALKKNSAALAVFENFSPSHRNEYIQWITEAKREETREKRVATALQWLSKGKGLNWKYGG